MKRASVRHGELATNDWWLPFEMERWPIVFAVGFAIASLLTSSASALWDGHFLRLDHGIQPLSHNCSTLVDFLLLDPLIIYLLCFNFASTKSLKINGKPFVSGPSWTMRVFALVLALTTTVIYAAQFMDGNTHDVMQVNRGIGGITLTGWTIYLWTGIFLFIFTSGLVHQSKYFVSVFRFSVSKIRYEPLHPDDAGGFSQYAIPASRYLYVVVLLFAIGTMFWIQDKFITPYHTGLRVAVVIIFIALTLGLVLAPVLKLRQMMSCARSHIIAQVNLAFEDLLNNAKIGSETGNVAFEAKAKELIELRNAMNNFPAWPLKIISLLSSGGVFVSSAIAACLPEVISIIRGK